MADTPSSDTLLEPVQWLLDWIERSIHLARAEMDPPDAATQAILGRGRYAFTEEYVREIEMVRSCLLPSAAKHGVAWLAGEALELCRQFCLDLTHWRACPLLRNIRQSRIEDPEAVYAQAGVGLSRLEMLSRVARQRLGELQACLAVPQRREEDTNTPEKPDDIKPRWDAELHELYFGAVLVKRYGRPAPLQWNILSTFEELGWPSRTDDPLTPGKLKDTVSNLNDSLGKDSPIRFVRDGTEGVRWERTG